MAVQAYFHLVFAVFLLFLSSLSQGFKFYVGGRDGWVLHPSENYNHWAGRNRFQVNDSLLFKFKKGEDSVLLVTGDNYKGCNVNNPIKSLTDEESEYKFGESGPHYFISGNADHCNKGQKIIIVVLAIRPKKTPPTPVPVVSSPPATLAPSLQPPVPASETQASSPSPSLSADGSSPSEKNNSGAVLKSPLMGVVLSVVIGVSVVLGCFSGMV